MEPYQGLTVIAYSDASFVWLLFAGYLWPWAVLGFYVWDPYSGKTYAATRVLPMFF